jgi:hypothetical protein
MGEDAEPALPEPVVLSFEFDEDGNAENWMQTSHSVSHYEVRGGSLHLTIDGMDPYWFAPQPLQLNATPGQWLEVRMKADKGDAAAIYFDTDLSPGLSEGKMIRFPIVSDGEYREYRVKLGSHPEWSGVIHSFRMDLEPHDSYPANVSIDYVRFIGGNTDGYEFNGTDDGWSAGGGLTPLVPGEGSVSATVTGADPYLVSPGIGRIAEDLGEMKLRMRSSAGMRLDLYFTTGDSAEFSEDRKLSVPITSDGQFHEYTIEAWQHPYWEGSIGRIRLDLEGAEAGAEWELDYLRFFSSKPLSFEWDEDGNTLGWLPAHSLSPFVVEDGVIRTTVTGEDPYMINNAITGLIGERDQTMQIRLSATAGSGVTVFFGTQTNPGFSEERKVQFPIEGDGQMREYTVSLGEHPGWRGRIINLRFDLDGADSSNAVFSIDSVRFVSAGAGADLQIQRSAPALGAGETALITAEAVNTGGKSLLNAQASLVLPAGLELVGDETAVVDLGVLPPGESRTLSWTVQAAGTGAYSIGVELDAVGFSTGKSAPLPVLKPLPSLNQDQKDDATVTMIPETEDVVLENAHIRIVFPRDSFGYGQYIIYVRDQGQWHRMASVQPFAYAIIRNDEGGTETVGFYPTVAEIRQGDGEAALTMSGAATDTSGREWDFAFDFNLTRDDQWVRVKQQVTANRDAELLNMTGPVLTAGERSFGSEKEEALFPGLEWLVGGEASSSQLDALPPHHLRVVPHPYKITMPLMAVKQSGKVVSLMWDPHQLWDGVHSLPAAKFASPNWLENQNNHVMGLSALSVPDWVRENEELAREPYPLLAGRTLSLAAMVAAAPADSVLTAVDLYLAAHGWPEVQSVRTMEEAVDLGLAAYLDTYWVEEAQGWRHVNAPNWGPQKFPSNLFLLRMLGLHDPEARDAAEARIREVLNAMADKSALGRPDGHIPQWQSMFHFGFMEQAMSGLRNAIRDIIDRQDASGAWLFYNRPDFPGPPLGVDGEPLQGETANNAQILLRYARMTGDQAAFQAGMKGLAALETMGDVPRAAQTWEVPVHTPDILASAKAAGAYLEAYQLTGEQQYLDLAVKWARTGFPFIYAWSVPERPMTPYATIPVFGATAYTRAWFAVPVQWNGLVYAYELYRLAQFDHSLPWEQIAQGIVASAEMQQAADPNDPSYGGYPDFWELIPDIRSDGVMINPEALLKNRLLELAIHGEGGTPDFNALAVRGCPEPSGGASPCPETRIATAAQIVNKSPAAAKNLVQFELTYPAGETTYVLVTQREQPRMVQVNGIRLQPAENLNEAAAGWSYDEEHGYLFIKVQHTGTDLIKLHYNAQ